MYEVLLPPVAPVDVISLVRVCGDKNEYWAYGGPRGTGGYWNARDEELVFFDEDESRQPDDNTISVLYHEAFHQYVFYAAGRIAPHSWFNEGYGDFFAGARYKDGKFRIEPFAWRLPTLQRALGLVEPPSGETTVSPIPLDRLVGMTRSEYYRTPALAYAQGWSLVYFLREIVPTNPEWQAKWGRILETYYRTLCQATARTRQAVGTKSEPAPDDPPKVPPKEGDPKIDPTIPPPSDEAEIRDSLEEARKAAFDAVDMQELEKAWKASIVALLTPRRR
jgi:hypothetical protein